MEPARRRSFPHLSNGWPIVFPFRIAALFVVAAVAAMAWVLTCGAWRLEGGDRPSVVARGPSGGAVRRGVSDASRSVSTHRTRDGAERTTKRRSAPWPA